MNTILGLCVGIIVVSCGSALFFLHARLRRIHGQSRAAEISLAYSPNSLTSLDLWAIILAVVAKYVPGTTAQRCRLEPKHGGFALPLLRLRGRLHLSPQDIAVFERALMSSNVAAGEQGNDANPFLLVSVTNPLLLVLLSHPRCPIRPFGAVNTKNSFKFHRALICRNPEELQAAAKADKLWFTATFGGPNSPGRPRRRGVEFDVTIQVWMDDSPIVTQNMSFLQFLPKSDRVRVRETAAKPEAGEVASAADSPDTFSTSFQLDKTAPRRWAASCKDYNPIHVSVLGAKAFGFPSVILHGNHAVALAVQALLGAPPESKTAVEARDICWGPQKGLKIEMSFLKPVVLPMKLDVQWIKAPEGVRFQLTDKHGKICISGSCA